MNIDKTERQPQDVFDDNFEVIYEGELPELPGDLGNDDYKDVLSNLSDLDTTSSLGIDYLEQNRTRTFTNLLKTKDGSEHHPNGHKALKKRSAADITLQIITLLLTVSITGFLAVSFWKHNSTYSDEITAIHNYNYILGAYYGISLFLLLIEWITFLNVLLNSNTVKGRGMFSFLFIYFGSLLSYQLVDTIPSSPVFMLGIREALTVYGSLNRTLLWLCSAGIAVCFIRRFYMIHKS